MGGEEGEMRWEEGERDEMGGEEGEMRWEERRER